MKILQIIYSLSSGGAERFVVDLSNELAEQGHEVTLCVLRDDRILNNGFYLNEVADKIHYISLRIPEGFRISNSFALYKLIKKFRPEVVHCHQNLINYLFPLTYVFNKTNFFHTIHSDASKEISNNIEYWIRSFFYKKQKVKAITISNETSKSFIKYYQTNKYNEICNGRKKTMQSKDFETVTKYVSDLRQNNNLIFIHVGRCAPEKNQNILINAFNRLIYNGYSAKLLIIGNGFDSEMGKELKAKACNNIHFLGQKHNVFDYYFNADAFCLSSIYEGMPITLIEAMACGCTPICTPVGGICDSIKNNETGILAKSTSEEDYYNAMLEYINNKDTFSKKNIIENYKKRFSIEKCAKKHILLYNKYTY